MKRSRYTEEQIIRSFAASTGSATPRFTSGAPSMAAWMSPDASKLKALEDENRKLKKLLAETVLDAATLKEMLGKNF
jgi:putative transposase